MNQPLGLDDFFVLEAGEYLDRLAALSASPTAPNGEELVRFTRALRGSALMANQPGIARAANALEHLLRGFRDGKQEWGGDLPARVREAVDILRTLVERVRNWSPDDAARAERLALDLEAAAGQASRGPAPAVTQSETGVRAFLAREAAALGSVLDQTSKSLTAGSATEETLETLVRRLQPLRGLAALADFPPLPDLLDGIERTAVSVSRLEVQPRHGAERLSAAADALVRAAREIADRGRPDPNGPEFQAFATLLFAPGAEEVPVVAIETLFFAGEDGIVKRGTPPRPEPRAPLGAAQVVSRGEHLVQAAEEIAQATSTAQRDLRFHVLLADLRTLSQNLPGGLEACVESFAVAARGAVTRGVASREAGRFADIIRDAGTRLRGYTEITQPGTLAAGIEPLIARLESLGTAAAPPPAIAAVEPGRSSLVEAAAETPPELDIIPVEELEAAPEMEPEILPIEALAPEPALAPVDHRPIVPIESLLYEEEAVAPVAVAPVVAPAAVATPPVAGDDWDLAASYLRFEELVAGVEAVATVAAVVEVAPEPPLVAIEELLYSGRAALQRADQVRRQLRSLSASAEPLSTIQPLVDELLDLVELAIAD